MPQNGALTPQPRSSPADLADLEASARRADHDEATAGRQQGAARRQGLLRADEVEDEIGAVAAVTSVQPGGRVRGCGYDGVRAELHRQLTSHEPRLDRDHARRVVAGQQLQREVTEPAHADHDDGGAGQQLPVRVEGVLGGQSGVGERRHRRRVDAIDRDEVARGRHQHVVRQAAVAADPAADGAGQRARQ